MATPSRKPNLTDYDVRLLELAAQLDAERRAIMMQFAQDLINIPYETEPQSIDPGVSSQLLH